MSANRHVKFGPLGLRTRGTGLLPPDEPGAKDERNLDYLIATAVAPQPEKRVRWSEGPQLDQGREGACVGFGFTAELMAAPEANLDVDYETAQDYARSHWMRAQYLTTKNPVIDPDAGASMSNGAKVCVERGFFDSYLWAMNIEDVRNAVIAEGPVVMATKMFSGLDSPSRQNIWEPVRGSKWFGAHCLCITGYDPARKAKVRGVEGTYRMFFIRNSWGKDWGERWTYHKVWKPGKKRKNGKRKPGKWVTRMTISRAGGTWITYEDLDYLLGEYGWGYSACLPVGRKPVDLAAALVAHGDHLQP